MSEIDFGGRQCQAVLVRREYNNLETSTRVKVDLMKEEDPKYAYIFTENIQKVLYCSVGGEKVERGMIQKAKLLHRAHNSLLRDLCFQESRDEDSQFVVIKSLRKSVIDLYLQCGGKENPYTELQVMRELGDNIHVLKCIEALQDDEFLHIITPYCSHGSLMEIIPGLPSTSNHCGISGFSEAEAKKFFRQILQILGYLQGKGVYHRDISLGNFMLYKGRLVLIDFAMSSRIPVDIPGCRYLINHQGQYGTFAFQAPEVFDKNFSFDGFRADLWSAAVVLYSMLTGEIMYYWPSPSDIYFRYSLLAKGLSRNPVNPLTEEILRGVVDTHIQNALISRTRANANVSSDAMDLLENLLAIPPTRRWSLEQAMESPWLCNTQE